MRKPKTNWNALTEEAKMGFFEFWLATKFFVGQAFKHYEWLNGDTFETTIEKPESECPGDYCKEVTCNDLCGTLFANLPD